MLASISKVWKENVYENKLWADSGSVGLPEECKHREPCTNSGVATCMCVWDALFPPHARVSGTHCSLHTHVCLGRTVPLVCAQFLTETSCIENIAEDVLAYSGFLGCGTLGIQGRVTLLSVGGAGVAVPGSTHTQSLLGFHPLVLCPLPSHQASRRANFPWWTKITSA